VGRQGREEPHRELTYWAVIQYPMRRKGIFFHWGVREKPGGIPFGPKRCCITSLVIERTGRKPSGTLHRGARGRCRTKNLQKRGKSKDSEDETRGRREIITGNLIHE